jgi:signal transduction histidine kinase
VDDLLNVSRITSGKLTINRRPTDPLPIVRQTIEAVRPTLEAKQLHLEADLDANIGAVVLDPDRFQQIVWNLLTNAVKFTPQGGSIRVQLQRGPSHAILRVVDTGQGIAPEFLPYVFDRFRQADSPPLTTHRGLGLGLAIVRHLVELHGGTVSVRSLGPGHGSTFSVQFPSNTSGQSLQTIEKPLPPALAQPYGTRRQAPSSAGRFRRIALRRGRCGSSR